MELSAECRPRASVPELGLTLRVSLSGGLQRGVDRRALRLLLTVLQ